MIDDRGPAHGGSRDRAGFGFEIGTPTTSVNCTVDPGIFPLHELDSGNFVTD
jgi:hypothetical protein